MQEAVSGVLAERSQQADGLSRMLLVSIAAHATLGIALWWAPGFGPTTEPENTAITISLLQADGPDTGGMTSIAGRAVQEIAKPDAPRSTPVAPASKPPEMVESTAKVPPRTDRPINKPDPTSKSRTPTTGAEIKTGSARVETRGAAVPFGGLASAKGGGSDLTTDLRGFCCPAYLTDLIQRIKSNWTSNMGATGQVVVKFTIRRDGVLVAPQLTKSSGQDLLDLEARRAVIRTAQLPPLPREYTESSLTIHLTFDYKR